MFLYLSRHGEASSPGPDKPSSLTPKGQAEVTLMAEHLHKKNSFHIDAIWHSPKTRAVQTAQIYWKVLGRPEIPLEEKNSLVPEGNVHEIADLLIRQKFGNLLLVSHLPFLPDLAAHLLSDSENPIHLSFPTSGLAAFELDKNFRLLWTLDPSSLKK